MACSSIWHVVSRSSAHRPSLTSTCSGRPRRSGVSSSCAWSSASSRPPAREESGTHLTRAAACPLARRMHLPPHSIRGPPRSARSILLNHILDDPKLRVLMDDEPVLHPPSTSHHRPRPPLLHAPRRPRVPPALYLPQYTSRNIPPVRRSGSRWRCVGMLCYAMLCGHSIA
jgi:hypothetical protein